MDPPEFSDLADLNTSGGGAEILSLPRGVCGLPKESARHKSRNPMRRALSSAGATDASPQRKLWGNGPITESPAGGEGPSSAPPGAATSANALPQGSRPISVNLRVDKSASLSWARGQCLRDFGPQFHHAGETLRDEQCGSDLSVQEFNFAPAAAAWAPRSSPRGKLIL